MRAVLGLGHDAVHHAQHQAIVGGHLERIGNVLGPSGVAMDNRRGAFRSDHGVDGVLLHQDAIGNAQG